MMSKFFFYTIISYLLFTNLTVAQQAFETEALMDSQRFRNEIEGEFEIEEVPVYSKMHRENAVLLENGYAEYRIKNPNDWPPIQGKRIVPTSVKIIFTKYPQDSAFWLTDYKWLLSKRLMALFQLDSAFNNSRIDYKILLQTDCSNEFETMQLFHGIEVEYAILEDQENTVPSDEIESVKSEDSPRNYISIQRLERFMFNKRYVMDSTVFRVLDRNRQWNNASLIMDWTGSMHGHGAEALLWQALNEPDSYIEHIWFFNDGDKQKDRKKQIGNTGGGYYSTAKPVYEPIKLMRKVENKGNGGDSPENDVEIVLESMNSRHSSNDYILIADNSSCMRDFILYKCIEQPIHIILCDTKNGINPQYINLAWKTGGSLHTKEWDIQDLETLVRNDNLVIDGVRYVIGQNGWIIPINRDKHYFTFCDGYYSKQKIKKNNKKVAPLCP